MKLYIRANSPVGLAHVVRAGRFWPHGETKEVEVLAQDDDPDPVQVKNKDGGTVSAPDPNRMGKKSLEAIKADARFSILSDPKAVETSADLERENSRLKARIAELEAEAARAGETEGHHARKHNK